MFPVTAHQFSPRKQFLRSDFSQLEDGSICVNVKYSKTNQFQKRSFELKLLPVDHILCPVSAIHKAFALICLPPGAPAFVASEHASAMTGSCLMQSLSSWWQPQAGMPLLTPAIVSVEEEPAGPCSVEFLVRWSRVWVIGEVIATSSIWMLYLGRSMTITIVCLSSFYLLPPLKFKVISLSLEVWRIFNNSNKQIPCMTAKINVISFVIVYRQVKTSLCIITVGDKFK